MRNKGDRRRKRRREKKSFGNSLFRRTLSTNKVFFLKAINALAAILVHFCFGNQSDSLSLNFTSSVNDFSIPLTLIEMAHILSHGHHTNNIQGIASISTDICVDVNKYETADSSL